MITEDGKLITPFTDDQVRSINTFQESGAFHPFTCPKCGSTLKATTVGINCYVCGKWFQTWVHAFMADWSWQGQDLGRIRVLEEIRGKAIKNLPKGGDDLGTYELDLSAGFDHKKFEEDAASGTGRFWLIRMPGTGIARFRGVLLPDYVRVLIDLGMDFAYVTVPQTQGIHSPLEVAQEVARALGAKRLLKDGVEVVM